ncbi:60S ribosomal protein L29 isoform X1 [Hypanus sabinus]|uniref:60S ribosomal protein L29 isoform X1 n=1 Tax=Hypanus sabinus TaxID=79690 RepID=UPI0028C38BF1|nr:60S ribosomal protein L29 isoform X1 [Hypanus sabinus]
MSMCLTPLRAVPKDIRPLCTFVQAEPSQRVRAAAGRERRLGYPGVLRAAPSFSGSGADCSVADGRSFEPWPSPRITPITISVDPKFLRNMRFAKKHNKRGHKKVEGKK